MRKETQSIIHSLQQDTSLLEEDTSQLLLSKQHIINKIEHLKQAPSQQIVKQRVIVLKLKRGQTLCNTLRQSGELKRLGLEFKGFKHESQQNEVASPKSMRIVLRPIGFSHDSRMLDGLSSRKSSVNKKRMSINDLNLSL